MSMTGRIAVALPSGGLFCHIGFMQALGGVLILFGIFLARPRTGQCEVGP
jgi:hypothetical protein